MVRLFLVLLVLAAVSTGQNYNFSIPEFSCTVEVNRDRTLLIGYEILFECTQGYSPVDIVDIGFPSEDFSLSDVEAEIDGYRLQGIYNSSYIDNGVEVHLNEHSVNGGNQGRFVFSGVSRDMVFLDTEEDAFASMEFSSTWFEGGILSGTSDFTLTVVFPPGAEPDLVRHHERPYTDSYVDQNGRVCFVWREKRRVNGPYTVGISFPDHLVDGPLSERPGKPLFSPEALVFILVFGFIFLIFGFIIFAIIKAVTSANKRREQYLPPKIGLEGTGIRRGLTAPMAALLLEEKLERVFVLVIFGLLKKGKLQMDGHVLKRTGSEEGLRSYEKEFLKLIPVEGIEKPIPEEDAKNVFTGMISELEKKMKGFSIKETREYYRSIIESAWKMVEADSSAERAGELLGDRFQWMLADKRYDQRVRKLPDNRTAILPAYMYGYLSGTAVSSAGTGMNLSQACSQLAGTLEHAAGSAVANLTSLARTVTSQTNPVPVSSSSRTSSGGGCACACACAGCACACAGGGR